MIVNLVRNVYGYLSIWAQQSGEGDNKMGIFKYLIQFIPNLQNSTQPTFDSSIYMRVDLQNNKSEKKTKIYHGAVINSITNFKNKRNLNEILVKILNKGGFKCNNNSNSEFREIAKYDCLVFEIGRKKWI